MAVGRQTTRTMEGKRKIVLVTVTGFRYVQDMTDKECKGVTEAMDLWVKKCRDSLITLGPDIVRASFIGIAIGVVDTNERLDHDEKRTG